MSKARDLADLAKNANDRLDDVATSDGALSHRNMLINGDHRVAQRGTSAVTVTTTASYRTVDRWKSDIDGSTGHDWSHEQSTDGPTGFGYSSKITVVTNGTQPTTAVANHQLYQLLEKQDVEHLEWGTSAAKTVTFSFYVKSSVTGDYGIRFIHYGSSTTPVYNTHYTINTADTWERKTLTITGPTTGGITSTANSQGLIVEFKLGSNTAQEGLSGYEAWETTNIQATKAGTVYLPATAGATWFVTGCQLEVGDTATPFEHRSYGDELARCQRFYAKSYDDGTAPATETQIGAIYQRHEAGTNVTNRAVYVRFPQNLRAEPAITLYALNGNSGSVSDCSSNFSPVSTVSGSSVSGTVGTTGFAKIVVGTSFDQIMGFHYTADAEL